MELSIGAVFRLRVAAAESIPAAEEAEWLPVCGRDHYYVCFFVIISEQFSSDLWP